MIRSSDKGKSQNINEVITDAMNAFMYINEVISYTIYKINLLMTYVVHQVSDFLT